MAEITTEYAITTPSGGWRIAGSRVSLDSVVHAWTEGKSAEEIAASFPSLSLEQIHGAIAFYLHNRAEIDRYMQQQGERWEELRHESVSKNGDLIGRIVANRASSQVAG